MKPTHQPVADTTTDPAMNPAALLRGAALYLKLHGWTKGQFFEVFDKTTQPFLPACASGAIMTAAHGHCPLYGALPRSADEEPTPEALAALTAMRVFAAHLDPEHDLYPLGPSAIDVIGDWNDDQDRTLDEVVEALTDAADDWDTAHPTGGAR